MQEGLKTCEDKRVAYLDKPLNNKNNTLLFCFVLFFLPRIQLSQTGGLASRTVESLHGEKRSEGASEGNEPELPGQRVPTVTGTTPTQSRH